MTQPNMALAARDHKPPGSDCQPKYGAVAIPSELNATDTPHGGHFAGMARAPRMDRPGAWHHVANRGLARRTLFESKADIRFFLSRVARVVRRGELEIHAYSILTTHFHF